MECWVINQPLSVGNTPINYTIETQPLKHLQSNNNNKLVDEVNDDDKEVYNNADSNRVGIMMEIIMIKMMMTEGRTSDQQPSKC